MKYVFGYFIKNAFHLILHEHMQPKNKLVVVCLRASLCNNCSLLGICAWRLLFTPGYWTDSFQRVTKSIETGLETQLKLLQ